LVPQVNPAHKHCRLLLQGGAAGASGQLSPSHSPDQARPAQGTPHRAPAETSNVSCPFCSLLGGPGGGRESPLTPTPQPLAVPLGEVTSSLKDSSFGQTHLQCRPCHHHPRPHTHTDGKYQVRLLEALAALTTSTTLCSLTWLVTSHFSRLGLNTINQGTLLFQPTPRSTLGDPRIYKNEYPEDPCEEDLGTTERRVLGLCEDGPRSDVRSSQDLCEECARPM
jgi:hypothetical protein